MIDLSKQNGLKVIYGEVNNIIFNSGNNRGRGGNKNNSKQITGVEYLPNNNKYKLRARKKNCSAVVICMGPWSYKAYKWFPECIQLKHITGLKNNSIVFETKTMDTAPDQGLFLNYNDVRYQVYPRNNNTIYAMGKAKETDLPDNNDDIKFDDVKGNKMIKFATDICSYTQDGEITRKDACYYPMSNDGNPLIGLINGTINGYIGCGHGCWGILLGPITGKMLSELIMYGGVKCVDENVFNVCKPNRKIMDDNDDEPPKKRRRIK